MIHMIQQWCWCLQGSLCRAAASGAQCSLQLQQRGLEQQAAGHNVVVSRTCWGLGLGACCFRCLHDTHAHGLPCQSSLSQPPGCYLMQ